MLNKVILLQQLSSPFTWRNTPWHVKYIHIICLAVTFLWFLVLKCSVNSLEATICALFTAMSLASTVMPVVYSIPNICWTNWWK
jgi:hypothetical protein